MNTTRQTKKVRASRVTAGMSINGQTITQVTHKDYYGAPGTQPWTLMTFHADDTVVLGAIASTLWVEVDR